MEYADRDIMELDKAGGYYCRHVSAMTGEGLHRKGDIAAELAHRDMEIDLLRAELKVWRDMGRSLHDAGLRQVDVVPNVELTGDPLAGRPVERRVGGAQK